MFIVLSRYVVDFSIQAYSNVTLEDVAVLGECCPPSHDSSLNLLVLVFVSGAGVFVPGRCNCQRSLSFPRM